MSKIDNIKAYLQINRSNNELFKDLFKIVVANEVNAQKQEKAVGRIKDLIKLVQLDSIDKLEQTSIDAQIKARLLKKFDAINVDEALAGVVATINDKYNPCKTPEERHLDLQAYFLVYCYNSQVVLNKLHSLEISSRIQNHETKHLEQLYERLSKEEIELREHFVQLRAEFDNAEYKNGELSSIEKEYLETKGLIKDRLKHLYKADDLLNKIEEMERDFLKNKPKEYPYNKPLEPSQGSGQKESFSRPYLPSRSDRDDQGAR